MSNLKKLTDELKFAIENSVLVDALDEQYGALIEELYEDPDFSDFGLMQEDVDYLVASVIVGIEDGMTEDQLVEMVLSDEVFLEAQKAPPGKKMVFGKWQDVDKKKMAVGAAKKLVRGAFKAHSAISKTHRQIKKAGGVGAWAKGKVKAWAKKKVGRLRTWAFSGQKKPAQRQGQRPAQKQRRQAPAAQQKPGQNRPSNVVKFPGKKRAVG